MLVDLSKSENEVLDSIRKTEKYKRREFEINYIELTSELYKLIESAKIYILDNYKRIEDYSELNLMLRCANHERTCYFGKKSNRKRLKSGKNKGRAFDRIIKELDDHTIEIKTFDQAVYDWTDGDFSVVFNNISYNWIDNNSIIDIASHIEKNIKNKT